MKPRLPVFLLGARGLLAGEFLRCLSGHRGLLLAAAATRRAGEALHELHPQLPEGPVTVDEAGLVAGLERALGAGPAALVLGLPHGESAPAWARIRAALGAAAAELFVVDLSADFRLPDAAAYQRTYGQPHPLPGELGAWVYGLPEFDRAALRGARRVAAPGCFATAMQLALLPAAQAGLLDAGKPWVLHAVTGSTGSGAAPQEGTHHPFRDGNLRAYALGGHRHEAEVAARFASPPPLHFLPHSGPFRRGIYLTAALPLAGGITAEEAVAAYAARYAGEPFVRLRRDVAPELRHVTGSNRADLGVSARGGVLQVLVALDNTLKGGAGQALQCLNLMLGFEETDGLPLAGLGW